jgi:hypothetical protein
MIFAICPENIQKQIITHRGEVKLPTITNCNWIIKIVEDVK